MHVALPVRNNQDRDQVRLFFFNASSLLLIKMAFVSSSNSQALLQAS